MAFRNEDWGRLNIGQNNFLLQRYTLHADVHIGERLRLFAQLRSAWQSGRKNGPRPTDEDRLNIQNLFVDMVAWQRNDHRLTLRLGRQEIDYGTGRLVSVREGPNARLYFTGGKILYASPDLAVDGFVLMADTVYPGALDNKRTGQVNLWGAYATRRLTATASMDLYYLGIRRPDALSTAICEVLYIAHSNFSCL